MIIVHLKGGLGNQLFQYAAGMSLAHHHGTALKVDVTELLERDRHIGTMRSFDLQKLNTMVEVATDEEIGSLHPRNTLQQLLDKLLPRYRRSVYTEKQYAFDPNFFEAGDHLLLYGYRQSERYFAPIAETIRQSFTVRPEYLRNVQAKAAALASTESVSIHIRRGDYNNPIVRDYHGVLGKEYYQAAIDHIMKTVQHPFFHIFSDDPSWVKQHLVFSAPVEIVSGQISHTHLEDFHLITQCKHNIIANSTFSWWAAWLNANPGKQVVAPARWFNKGPKDTQDLIPHSWTRL